MDTDARESKSPLSLCNKLPEFLNKDLPVDDSTFFEEKIDALPPSDRFLDIVLATKENTAKLGWLITDEEDAIIPGEEISIPFYETVQEGPNLSGADWKDQPCVRQAKITWRDDNRVLWMERHMEMTQGFFCVGKNPGLFVLGEPTHDRDDLKEEDRAIPDLDRVKAYVIPGGMGIIIRKGTWHDFPISLGPPVTVFIINTDEVIDALQSMETPGEMDFGDTFKIRASRNVERLKLRFPDPRPYMQKFGFSKDPTDETTETTTPPTRYGHGMIRKELQPIWGGKGSSSVWVVPVINVEHFNPGSFGPSVQAHLNVKGQRELANSGWRDYGNKRGLSRLASLFRHHGIPCTAVVSSDLVSTDPAVIEALQSYADQDGWEMGAHGANNSNGGHAKLSKNEQSAAISSCLESLGKAFGDRKPSTWLTPGFSVTEDTTSLLADAGISTLLDFVDDDVPYTLTKDNGNDETGGLLCIPYSMETNDFSLVLTRHLSPCEYAASLESHILQLAREAHESGSPRVVCLGMHTFVAGTPASVYELDKILGRLAKGGAASDNIIWATASQVTAAVQQGPVLSEGDLMEGKNAILSSCTGIVTVTTPNATPTLTISARPCGTLRCRKDEVGLVMIDFQYDFLKPGGFGEQLGNDVGTLCPAVGPAQQVLAAARKAGITVVHTREGHRNNLSDVTALKAGDGTSIGSAGPYGRILVRGEVGHDIIPELYPLVDGSETIIDKPGKGAFYQTDLELILRNAGVSTIMVCGVTTEVCVHTTVREANDRGIRCIVLEDCCASYFPEFHRVGIAMIEAQGGIFGQVSDSVKIVESLKGIS